MFNFITSLFDETNSSTLKKGLDLIDNSFYTEQEKQGAKSELLSAKIELIKEHSNFVKTALKDENKGRSHTRRFMAMTVIFLWIPTEFALSVLGIYYIIYDPSKLSLVKDLMYVTSQPTLMVLGFYFGSQVLSGLFKK